MAAGKPATLAAAPRPRHISSMEPDATLDITQEMCPMTFVRTRLALDRLPAGALLAVRLQGEEPLRNVPASAARLGHEVTVTPKPDGTAEILIRKAGQAKPA